MLHLDSQCNGIVRRCVRVCDGCRWYTQRVSPSVTQWLWRRFSFFFSPSAFTCWSRVIRTRAFSRAHAYFVRVREQFLLGRLPRVCLSGCSCCWHRHWLTKLYAVWSSLRVALAIRKFMQILAVSYFISSRCGKTDATFCHHLVDLRPYLMLNYGQTVSNEYKLRKKRK